MLYSVGGVIVVIPAILSLALLGWLLCLGLLLVVFKAAGESDRALGIGEGVRGGCVYRSCKGDGAGREVTVWVGRVLTRVVLCGEHLEHADAGGTIWVVGHKCYVRAWDLRGGLQKDEAAQLVEGLNEARQALGQCYALAMHGSEGEEVGLKGKFKVDKLLKKIGG